MITFHGCCVGLLMLMLNCGGYPPVSGVQVVQQLHSAPGPSVSQGQMPEPEQEEQLDLPIGGMLLGHVPAVTGQNSVTIGT